MNIQRIKIMMVTNIPTSEPIEFSGNMLYHPSYPEMKNIGTYPYITDTIDYSNLNIAYLTYPQIAAIFFDRSKFIQLVSKTNPVKEKEKPATLERNVMTMLRLLLPTKFFAVNNHKQSIKLLDPDVVDSSSILYNPLKTESSYINIQGKPYTITEVVWLNDILNHPKYRKLLEEVYNLNQTLNAYKTTLMSKMKAYIKRITDLMDDIYNLIKTAISGTKSPASTTIKVNNGYANEKTYSAIFTILRLKNLLTGGSGGSVDVSADVSAIYNELYEQAQTADKVIQSVPQSVTTTTNPFAKIAKTTSGTITLEDQLIGIATEPATDIKNSPIQINRFEKVLALMLEYRTELSDIIKLADNADKVALVTKTNELFSETVLKEGSNLAAQLKATDSIVFSKQTYGTPDYIQVLSQFKTNILYQYRTPQLRSENKYLQDYIDNDTNPAVVTEWFNKFVEIYNMYVLKSTALKSTETLETIKILLRLGINNINIDKTDNTIPKIEMYVKMHLIDGVVTNYNKYQIYCPLTSDKLGSELLALLKNPTDYANLLNEDVSLFDVKTLSSTNSASNVQNDEKQPQNVPRNQNVQYNKNVPNPNIRSTMFGPVIASAKPDELNELITNINRNPEFNLNSNPESIISFISSTYNDARTSRSPDYLPDLPNIIYKWNRSNRRPNIDLEEQITRMNANLTAEQTILENKLNDVKTNANPTEQSKVTNKLDIIKFYKYIGELLLKNEQTKLVDRQSGGKKNNKKYTAKRRTKYINSKSRRRKKH